ncbi:MAG: superinfection immunity protein [Brevundimonas sp.]|nr:superinfection immunity protein [Brevundimonas sp.]
MVVAILAFLYFLPTGLAWSRHHHQATAILLLNLFLGWTVLGWIVALVWAATSPSAVQAVVVTVQGATVATGPQPPTTASTVQPTRAESLFCAQCGKKREGTLNFCRHCGATLA